MTQDASPKLDLIAEYDTDKNKKLNTSEIDENLFELKENAYEVKENYKNTLISEWKKITNPSPDQIKYFYNRIKELKAAKDEYEGFTGLLYKKSKEKAGKLDDLLTSLSTVKRDVEQKIVENKIDKIKITEKATQKYIDQDGLERKSDHDVYLGKDNKNNYFIEIDDEGNNTFIYFGKQNPSQDNIQKALEFYGKDSNVGGMFEEKYEFTEQLNIINKDLNGNSIQEVVDGILQKVSSDIQESKTVATTKIPEKVESTEKKPKNYYEVLGINEKEFSEINLEKAILAIGRNKGIILENKEDWLGKGYSNNESISEKELENLNKLKTKYIKNEDNFKNKLDLLYKNIYVDKLSSVQDEQIYQSVTHETKQSQKYGEIQKPGELNIDSYNKIISGKNTDELKEILKNLQKGTAEAKKYLEDNLKYKASGFGILTEKEIKNFIDALKKQIEFQEGEIDITSFIIDISDINQDGKSEAGKENWYVGEALLRQKLIDLYVNNKKDFINLFVKLGLITEVQNLNNISDPKQRRAILESFYKSVTQAFKKDPTGFKNKFRDELGLRLASGIPISTILSSKEGDYLEQKLKSQKEFIDTYLGNDGEKEIKSILENNKKIQEIKKQLPGDVDWNRTYNAIRLEAIGFVVGSSTGVGASFDIKDATNDFLDKLVVGVINGVPGIGIIKTIYKSDNDRVTVDAGMVNFIPFLGAKGELYKPDRLPSYFNDEIKQNFSVSSYLGVSPTGLMIGLTGEKLKKKEVQEKIEDMSKILDKIIDSIKQNKDIDLIGIEGLDKLTQEERAEFDKNLPLLKDKIVRFYNQSGKKPEFLNTLKDGYLKYYEDTLYSYLSKSGGTGWKGFDKMFGLEGIHFAGFGIGLLISAGIIPIGGISFQKIDTNYTKTESVGSSGIEAGINQKSLPLNWEIKKYKNTDLQVLFIPKTQSNLTIDNISADHGVQVEETKDGYLIGGNLLRDEKGNIKLDLINYSDNKGLGSILYIGGVQTNSNGDLVINKNYKQGEITTGVDIKTQSKFEGENKDIEFLSGITKSINQNIDRRSLDSSKLAQQLDRYVFDNNYAEAWNIFLKLINVNKYFKKIDFGGIQIKDITHNQQKIILDRVYGAFMKDIYVLNKAGLTDAEFTKKQNELESKILSQARNKKQAQEFIKEVQKGDKGIFTKHPNGVDDNLAREYLHMMMNLSMFDKDQGSGEANWDRQKAFDNRLLEFIGLKKGSTIDVRSQTVLTELHRARSEHYNKFQGSHFECKQYTQGDLITFPVKSQLGGLKGIKAISGSPEVAMPKIGEAFTKINSPEITNALIDNLPIQVLDAIQKSLVKQYPTITDQNAVKNIMKNGPKDIISFDTVYFKWGECFNDAYGIKNIKLGTGDIIKTTSSEVTALNAQGNPILNIGIGFTGSDLKSTSGQDSVGGGTAGKTKIEDPSTPPPTSSPSPSPTGDNDF